MNQFAKPEAPLRIQSGFTLIEVMVSLAIGLAIMIAIGTVYSNSTNLARQRENQAEVNQPARVAMRQLQHDLSMAGYVDIFDFNATNQFQAANLFIAGNEGLANLYQRVPEAAPLQTPLSQFFPGLLPVYGCDGAMASTPNSIVTGAPPLTLSCGTSNAVQHSLQIAYQAAPSTTANPQVSLLAADSSTGEGNDCLQQGAPGATTGNPAQLKFVINRFYVRASPGDGVNELYCAGSGSATEQPLVRGVEEFVLRYQLAQPGIAPAVGDPAIAAGGAQSQYASATTVSDVALNPLGWANVTAVEVCIVSATAPSGGTAAQGTTQLQPTRPTCARDAASGAFAANVARVAGDTRLWKRFTTVVTVRNAVFSSQN